MLVPATGEVCDYVTEENYVFKLDPSSKEEIRTWANEAVLPLHVRNKVLADINDQNKEISISRPKHRLSWGIEVPDDDS